MDGGQLSSKDLEFLSRLLRMCCPSLDKVQQQPEATKLNRRAYALYSRRFCKFWLQHERVFRKVEDVLAAFNIDKVHKYRFHFICGVNELVCGPEYSPSKDYNPWMPYKYHHCHINFLATCEDPQFPGAPAMLFAECSNYGIDKESWCLPLTRPHPNTEQPRCIYCEQRGIPIVHPPVKKFHGRDTEFEKELRGERLFSGLHKGFYDSYVLTCNTVDPVGFAEDDCIYSTVCKEDDDDGVVDKLQRYREVCDLFIR